eukprot:NODE_61_length_25240_cov_0.547194.p4 type:complete len:435 gc:universal NODE_61_length_25240_cov_0.547194:15554-14250(-)
MNDIEDDNRDIDNVINLSADIDTFNNSFEEPIQATRKFKLQRKSILKSSSISSPKISTEAITLILKDPMPESKTLPNSPQNTIDMNFRQKNIEMKSASWSHLPVLKTSQLSPSELMEAIVENQEESAKIIQRAYRLHLIRLHFKKIKELNLNNKNSYGVTHPPTMAPSVRVSMSQMQLKTNDPKVQGNSPPLEAINQSLSESPDVFELKKSTEKVVYDFQTSTGALTQDFERVETFNKKPKDCVKMFVKQFVEDELIVQEVANFINSSKKLDKSKIGELLGEPDEIYLKILKRYVTLQHFKNLSFDEALRLFMQKFKLQGEAQKIDRIMNEFATQYCADNPAIFKSPVTAYVLAFSIIMLNTDAHNQNIKKKMTLQEFLRNNRGIDDGKDLNDSFLKTLYFDIKFSEIKMNENADQKGIDIWNSIVPKPIVFLF